MRSNFLWKGINMALADQIIIAGGIGMVIAFIYIVWSYVNGLGESPKELWMLMLFRTTETVSLFLIYFILVLWLSHDCGLGDVEAGLFITALSVGAALLAFVVGPLVDKFGVKNAFFICFISLIISRFFMSWATNA